MDRRSMCWREHGVLIGGGVAAVAVALWTTRGAWGARPPAGEDVMGHLVRLDFGVAEIVGRGRLDGWFPSFYLGYQEFLFNGPGLAWTVALLRAATFGALSNPGAFKVVGILSFAAVPPTVAFAARGLGLGRRAAAMAAVLSLLVSNLFGVGLAGLYVIGLVPHQLGAVWFFVALGALARIPLDPRARWVTLGAVSLAALAVTHLISLMVLVVLVVVLGGLRIADRSPARPTPSNESAPRPVVAAAGRGFGAGLLAAGLAAWWLVPFVAHRALRGPVATWSTPPLVDRLDEILHGRLLFEPYTGGLVMVAWGYGAWRWWRRRRFAVATVLAPLLYLLIAHELAARQPRGEVALQLANRGLGYVGIVAVLPLATALAGGARWLAKRPALCRHSLAPAVIDAAAIGVAVVAVLSPLGPDRHISRQFPDAAPELAATAEVLGARVPAGARFAVEADYPAEVARTGVLHPDTWLARASGAQLVSGFNLESSNTPQAALVALGLTSRTVADSADLLARYGVTHLVTTGGPLADRLEASPRFRRVWSQPPMAVFAVRARPGAPDPASLLSPEPGSGGVEARVLRAQAERLSIEADATSPTAVTIAVAWSPHWQARVDGRTVDVTRSADGLIRVRLPRGRSVVALTYQPDAWEHAGAAATVATIVVGLVVAAWLRVRRCRARARS